MRPVASPSGRATYLGRGRRSRDEIRAAAAAVGTELQSRVGYRGAFCIDGILTPTGFYPTELNHALGRFAQRYGPVDPRGAASFCACLYGRR